LLGGLIVGRFDYWDTFSYKYYGNHCILWDCFIVVLLVLGFSLLYLTKVAMETIAYCMGKRTKSIAAFRYRGSIDIF
jgi:hypothetical protein